MMSCMDDDEVDELLAEVSVLKYNLQFLVNINEPLRDIHRFYIYIFFIIVLIRTNVSNISYFR